jgi:hypothetical protein
MKPRTHTNYLKQQKKYTFTLAYLPAKDFHATDRGKIPEEMGLRFLLGKSWGTSTGHSNLRRNSWETLPGIGISIH